MSEFGEFFEIKFPNIQATIYQTHSEESILLKKACRMVWNARQSEIDQLKTTIQGLGDAVTRQLGIIVDREREIKQLKAQLNNMEQCYIEKKKQVEGQRGMIAELKDSLSTQKIEHYEMYGRINYAHHCFTSMSRNHFYKIIEEVIRGRLRHPDFSFDRTRIKALRGGDQNTKNSIQVIESNANRGGDQNGEH